MIELSRYTFAQFAEQRLQVASTGYRIPDVLVLPADYDRSPVVAVPPLLWIELPSPGDTMVEVVERSEDYLRMNVPPVWIFEPVSRKAYVKDEHGLREASPSAELSCGQIRLSLPELFADL